MNLKFEPQPPNFLNLLNLLNFLNLLNLLNLVNLLNLLNFLNFLNLLNLLNLINLPNSSHLKQPLILSQPFLQLLVSLNEIKKLRQLFADAQLIK